MRGKGCIILILLLSFLQLALAQSQNEKKFKVRKVYDVSLYFEENEKGKTEYFANGKKIGKRRWLKFSRNHSAHKNCCPCIYKVFNESEQLITKSTGCNDCLYDDYKEFYPNAQLKVQGQ